MDNEGNVMMEILERLTKIEAKLDGYNDAKRKTYENEKDILKLRADVEALKKDNEIQNAEIAEQKDKNKWLFRTVAGAIVTGLVGICIAFISMGIGARV